MSSPDAHTLTGAYALDALEESERRQFEAHLAQCPACAREVQELRATAARLGTATTEAPPQGLRARVMARVATTRQDPPQAAPIPTRAPGAGRRRPARWGTRLTALAAAVATVAAVALGVTTVRAAQQRDTARAELAQVQAQYQPLAQLTAAPDARGGTGNGVDGGTAFVLASHQLNKAALLTSQLPAPPPGHTYQAWLLGATSQPRSVGLLPPAPPATATTPPLVFSGLDQATKIGLTLEPAGGSTQPTTTPVVLFDLPG